jgi:hypothetical protein
LIQPRGWGSGLVGKKMDYPSKIRNCYQTKMTKSETKKLTLEKAITMSRFLAH